MLTWTAGYEKRELRMPAGTKLERSTVDFNFSKHAGFCTRNLYNRRVWPPLWSRGSGTCPITVTKTAPPLQVGDFLQRRRNVFSVKEAAAQTARPKMAAAAAAAPRGGPLLFAFTRHTGFRQ